jgi:hypothetical protein
MTLDEAIEHAEWCAENTCGECAEEHRQLAEWLRELRDKRAEERSCAAIAAEAARQNRDLYAERAKLRDLVLEMYEVAGDYYGCDSICRYRDQCCSCHECVFETRMRELGIEVK